MRSLTATLLAAQKKPARTPAHILALSLVPLGVPQWRWSRYYSGTENDDPIAATVATDGSLIRLRANGTTIEVSRVATPGPGSTYSSWSTLASGATDGPVALAAGPSGEVIALYTTGSGLNLVEKISTDNGQTFGTANTLVTEATAIDSIALAFGQGADCCAFYTLTATTTLKRLRRTSGSWAGAGTTWSRTADVTAVNGVAATYDGADYWLVITGTTATDAHPRVWGAIMGDSGLPTNAWSTLTTVMEADANGTTSYRRPAAVYTGSRLLATFTTHEAGNVTYDRTFLTTATLPTSQEYREPQPLEAQGAEGAALARQGSVYWLVTAPGVWSADTSTALTVSGQLAGYDLHHQPGGTSATIELEETEAIAGLQDFAGGNARLSIGLQTSSGAEYGHVIDLRIDRVVRQVDKNGRRRATLHCTGAWEQAARHHNPQAWQTAAGTLSRGQIFARLAARAGVQVNGTGGANWGNIKPSFAWAQGETAAAALRRLVSVAEEPLRHDEGAFRVISLPGSSSYAYGPSQHPIHAFSLATGPAPANWARLQGPDRYAQAVDHDQVARYGPLLHHARNLDASTDQKAQDYADAVLARAAWLQPAGHLTVGANVGQELFDLISVQHDALGVDQDYRVIGLRYVYQPLATAPRFDTVIELGEP